jgi:hypothetical protein
MDFQALTRFQKSKADFKLTKIGSKRASSVGVGQFEVGELNIFEFKQRLDEKEPPMGVRIIDGRGFSGGFLQTSPFVKIVDQDDQSTTFETEGGIYKLEKL